MYCTECGKQLLKSLACPGCHYSLLPVVSHATDGGVKHYLNIEVSLPSPGVIRAWAYRPNAQRLCIELRIESIVGRVQTGPFDLFNDECLIVEMQLAGQLFTCTRVSRQDRQTESHRPLIVVGHQPRQGAAVGDIVINQGHADSSRSNQSLAFEQLHLIHHPNQSMELITGSEIAPSEPPDQYRTSDFLERHMRSLAIAPKSRDLPFPGVENWRSILYSFADQAIEELNLSYANITDAHLSGLHILQSLVRLNLSFCEQITDQSLGGWLGLPQLRRLDLFCCPQITIEGLKALVRGTVDRCCSVRIGGLGCKVSLAEVATLRLVEPIDSRVEYIQNGLWIHLKGTA